MAKLTQAQARTALQPATSALVGGILSIMERRLLDAGVGKRALYTTHLNGPLWVYTTYLLFTEEMDLKVGPQRMFNPAAQPGTITAAYARMATAPDGGASMRLMRFRSGANTALWAFSLGGAAAAVGADLADDHVAPGDTFYLDIGTVGDPNPGSGLEVWMTVRVDVQHPTA